LTGRSQTWHWRGVDLALDADELGASGSDMQSSSTSGRKVRLALLPLSWLVALVTVAGVLMAVAGIRGTTVRHILQTRTLWPLAVILPAFIFGKALGLIAMNVIGYLTPLRRVFERECQETGRQDFAAATGGLVRVALVLFVLTVAGAVAFLSFGS
jgi:hypothetical protein